MNATTLYCRVVFLTHSLMFFYFYIRLTSSMRILELEAAVGVTAAAACFERTRLKPLLCSHQRGGINFPMHFGAVK